MRVPEGSGARGALAERQYGHGIARLAGCSFLKAVTWQPYRASTRSIIRENMGEFKGFDRSYRAISIAPLSNFEYTQMRARNGCSERPRPSLGRQT